MIDALKALSDENRFRMFRLLALKNGSLCVCELEEILGVPQYSVSRGMKELKSAGLVKGFRRGRFMYYEAANAGIWFDSLQEAVLKVTDYPQDEERLLSAAHDPARHGRCEESIF